MDSPFYCQVCCVRFLVVKVTLQVDFLCLSPLLLTHFLSPMLVGPSQSAISDKREQSSHRMNQSNE